MVIPSSLLEAVKKVQDIILICPPVISQYAALGALEVGVSYCQERLQQINEVGQLMKQKLQALENVTIGDADGAFYFFSESRYGDESNGFGREIDSGIWSSSYSWGHFWHV